jgi:L-asparagine transporter-like permease
LYKGFVGNKYVFERYLKITNFKIILQKVLTNICSICYNQEKQRKEVQKMKNKKLILTILGTMLAILLTLPMVILDGDGTAMVLALIFGIFAIHSEIYNLRKKGKKK